MSDPILELFGEAPPDSSVQADALGAAPAASPTVLDMSRYAEHTGAELAAEWARLEAVTTAPPVAADAFQALYAPEPRASERPADRERAAWWRTLLAAPETAAVRAQTVLRPALAELAACAIAQQWAAYQAEQPEEPGDAGEPGTPGQPGDAGEPIGRTVARIRSVAKAVRAAQQVAQDAEAAAMGLGMGDVRTLPPQQVADMARLAAQNEMLRRILRWAGSFRRLAGARRRERTDAPRGGIHSVELSGDIGRLMPMELALVAGAVPELHTLALYRLAQRRALSYRHSRRVRQGAGALVVSVDESGSMVGEKIGAAKGLVLAMAWLARQERRPCYLVGWSDAPGDAYCGCDVAAGPAAVAGWATHFYNGGTSLEAPCRALPAAWPGLGFPRGRTDHIIITDAEVSAPTELVKSYRAWAAAEQVTTYAIVLAADAGDIAEIADHVWLLPTLDLNTVPSELLTLDHGG